MTKSTDEFAKRADGLENSMQNFRDELTAVKQGINDRLSAEKSSRPLRTSADSSTSSAGAVLRGGRAWHQRIIP